MTCGRGGQHRLDVGDRDVYVPGLGWRLEIWLRLGRMRRKWSQVEKKLHVQSQIVHRRRRGCGRVFTVHQSYCPSSVGSGLFPFLLFLPDVVSVCVHRTLCEQTVDCVNRLYSRPTRTGGTGSEQRPYLHLRRKPHLAAHTSRDLAHYDFEPQFNGSTLLFA